MKAVFWWLVAGAGLLVLLTAGYFYVRELPCASCAHESAATDEEQLDAQHLVSADADPEHYQAAVGQENSRKQRFPPTPPAYAQVHFDRWFKSPERLSPARMQQLLQVLNDTASYQWGEIGTPYFDRVITFHDSAGRCIGLTRLSYDSQTYSTPSLAKMKWGELRDDALHAIIETLRDTTAITDPFSRP